MERFTISLKPDLAEEFDRLILSEGYSNRSEAVRDLIRQRTEERRLETSVEGHCVAVLTYVYGHHELSLSSRLMASQHAHHDLTISTTHVHLDHDNCLETLLLRGPSSVVHAYAQRLMAVRGVRHGNLHMIPVVMDQAHQHSHHGPELEDQLTTHVHSRPTT